MTKESVLLLAVFLSLHLGATTYYVAKTGNDANPGTESEPWLTIRHAANAVVAGDTVWVKAGTYTENDTISFAANAGTAESPVVFKSYDGWSTVINAEIGIRQKHIRLEDFRLLYSRCVASQEVKFLADSCIVSGCELTPSVLNHGIYGTGILLGSGHLRGITITGNTIHGFGRDGSGHGVYANQMVCGTITQNTVYDNATYGIQAYPSVESSEIAYNICYDNPEGSGILLHGYYNMVHHNICYGNGGNGITLYADDYWTENHDNEVANNVCYGNKSPGLEIRNGPNLIRNNICMNNKFIAEAGQLGIDSAAAGKIALDYNCYYPDGWIAFLWAGNRGGYYGYWATYRESTAQDSHGICQDPLFVDAAGRNFRLQAGSPCIDAGDPTTPPGFDLDHVPTPLGAAVDIGAYEYREAVTSMSAPPISKTLAIVPSPLSGGIATVRYSLPKAAFATLNVFDVTGRRVLARTMAAGGTGTASLDLRKLEAGVYLVRVTTEGFSTTPKLVVTR